MMNAKEKEARYLSWDGNHIFCCSGRVMLGSNVKQLLFTVGIIALSYVYYYLTLRPAMTSFYESRIGEMEAMIVTIVVPGVFFLCSLASLFLTVITEPGIVPKQLSSNKIRYLSDELRKFDRYSFCQTCNIMRDGTHTIRHCRHCNACVSGLDHHCPWLGCCIGQRNYKLFVWFIGSMVVAYLWIFSHVILLVVEVCSSSLLSGRIVITAAMGMFVSAVILCFTATLLGFHCYLMNAGLSTAQYFRPADPGSSSSSNSHSGAESGVQFPSVQSLSNLSNVELGLFRMQSPATGREIEVKSSSESTAQLSVDSFLRQGANFSKLTNNVQSVPSDGTTTTDTQGSEDRDEGSVDMSFSGFSAFSTFSALPQQEEGDEVPSSCLLLPSKLKPQHQLDQSADRRELLKSRKITKLLLQKQLLYHKFNEHKEIMSSSPSLPLKNHHDLRAARTTEVSYSGGALELDTGESVKA